MEVFAQLAGSSVDRLSADSRELAQTPQRHGGLGLRSLERTSPAAFYGAWASILPEMHKANPEMAARCCGDLETGQSACPGVQALAEATAVLRGEGFEAPAWRDLVAEAWRVARESGDARGKSARDEGRKKNPASDGKC